MVGTLVFIMEVLIGYVRQLKNYWYFLLFTAHCIDYDYDYD